MSITVAMCALGPGLARRYWKSKYISALKREGVQILEVVLGMDLKEVVQKCDGLLLPGGADIDPGIYGQTRSEACGEINPVRDELDFPVLREFLDAGKPVFGVCRGMQVLNVALGGTMHQDIKTTQKEKHADFKNRVRGNHQVTITPGTRLDSLLPGGRCKVNSLHHQAADRIGQGLVVAAMSDDGYVEALELPEHRFCLAVQWHPEHMAAKSKGQQGLFHAFVEACKET